MWTDRNDYWNKGAQALREMMDNHYNQLPDDAAIYDLESLTTTDIMYNYRTQLWAAMDYNYNCRYVLRMRVL